MKSLPLHRWDVTPAEARRIQEELRRRVRAERPHTISPERIRRIAGADVALDTARGRAIAGVLVYSFPALEELERAWSAQPLQFPYVPGLLSFREVPALLAAVERLRESFDLLFCDAHGYAHPRRFGLACHLGVLLGQPTVGVAKSRLIGTHAEPAPEPGAWAPLLDAGETIGAVLRTRAGARPVYVSVGYRIELQSAIQLTLAVCDGYRIPRPTREADHYVEAIKRSC
ncbi:MAG: deoxyribonuclease V [Firmicutes bacterium]|nr:deoxyribonuclease V [Bacillota bacterium]